ncbi:SlyX family protein [Rubrivivax gelatinosus]|uniref:SlyX family protein n=1 Tax=Rubrivivax gelatinosus (strain NBRC 100245 / IL144) TaxID=983917 RepID=I0HLQ5_RUBGI|nr:SlyX family protein [Rubrivivax gelatinosus]BAL93942.1 SlyX family protein [Rubrivivax gelatinosus IL144]
MATTSRARAEEARVERRLEDLEIKLAFTEDLLEKLDAVVVRQQQQIDLLTKELVELKRQGASAEPATWRSLREELPPHY